MRRRGPFEVMDWQQVQAHLEQGAYREVAERAVLGRRPWIFPTDSEYAGWQRLISDVLGESAVEMRIVGSAATGFSLNPLKAGRPFRSLGAADASSDIDFALISSALFEGGWNEVLRVDREVGHGRSEHAQRMRRNVYNGFLSENWVPPRTISAQWLLRIKTAVGSVRPFRGYPLAFRAYRRIDDLHAYHVHSLKQLHDALSNSQG